jgi:hypothetical protein
MIVAMAVSMQRFMVEECLKYVPLTVSPKLYADFYIGGPTSASSLENH